jgi:hypothetical protein
VSTLPILEAVARDVEVVGPSQVRVGGRTVHEARGRGNLEGAVTRIVYEGFYLRRALADAGDNVLLRPVDEAHPAFGLLLEQANTGRGWVAPGWTVVGRLSEGRLRITDGDIYLVIDAKDCAPTAPVPAVGDAVDVRFPNAMTNASPGYYLAIGDEGAPRPDVTPTCRVYVHALPASAALLLRRLTRFLNARRHRGVVKVLHHPGAYDRPDALVLWLERDVFLSAADHVRGLIDEHGAPRGASSPTFAKPWFSGVAIADEPAPGRRALSFGEHRSRVVARGLVAANASGASSPSARLAAIHEALEREHLEAARLWMNDGARDVYPATEGIEGHA